MQSGQSHTSYEAEIKYKYPKPSLKDRLLQWLGYKSRCCNAKTYFVEGWNRTYCSKCNERC